MICKRSIEEFSSSVHSVVHLKTLGYYSLSDSLSQLLADHGCADISLTFTVQLSPEEIEAVAIDRAEYGDACWVDPAAITPDASYHTAMRR